MGGGGEEDGDNELEGVELSPVMSMILLEERREEEGREEEGRTLGGVAFVKRGGVLEMGFVKKPYTLP